MAPWDWSGILLARIIHEAAFFALVTDSETQQRNVLQQFINEVGLLTKPPLVYREMLDVATSVVRTSNGRCGDLWRCLDVYGSYRSCKKQEAEMAKLNNENRQLRTTVRTLTTEH